MYLEYNFDKLYDDEVIKRPRTPSVWVTKDVCYDEITRIKMSCGGGMGGSKWYEYVERVPLDALAKIGRGCVVLRTYEGKDVLINMDYVVEAEQFTVASAVLDSRNPYFPVGYYKFCYLIEDGRRNLTLID